MEQNEILYDENGQETKVEKSAYAKKVTYDGRKLVHYFVKYSQGGLQNPRDTMENSRRTVRGFQFRKTNELTFTLYMKFLRTRNNSALLQARREMGGG